MLGTSTNKLEQCVDLTRDLTKFKDTFHKHMTAFSERRTTRTRLRNKKLNDTNRHINTAKVEKLEFEFNNFKLNYFSVISRNQPHYNNKGDPRTTPTL
ncbi:unnamed protein product [Rhizophagus irregularis]|nr:unnamed protein product [Rhizophagus irregularis]